MLTVLLAASTAQAQAPAGNLADPMRPPNAPGASEPQRAPAAAGAGVQVILTSPQRKLAVIDGKVVPLGSDARGGTLVGLSDAGAVLSKQGERDVLLMHPGIDKRPPQ